MDKMIEYIIAFREFGKVQITAIKYNEIVVCYKEQVLFKDDLGDWQYSKEVSDVISIGRYDLEYDRVIVSWNIFLNQEEIMTIQEGLDDTPVFLTIRESDSIKF